MSELVTRANKLVFLKPLIIRRMSLISSDTFFFVFLEAIMFRVDLIGKIKIR